MTQSALFDPVLAEHDTGCKNFIQIPPDWWVEDIVFDGPNNCFRYLVVYRWAPGAIVTFAMKNPSAALAKRLDSTLAKCGRLAKRWQYSGFAVVNACAHRHRDPKTLLSVADPVGPGNIEHILRIARVSDKVIVAHGILPKSRKMDLNIHARAMVQALVDAGFGDKFYRLGLAGDGVTPLHPLTLGKLIIPENAVPVRHAPAL